MPRYLLTEYNVQLTVMVYASNYEGLGLGPATLLENCQSQKDHVSNFNINKAVSVE